MAEMTETWQMWNNLSWPGSKNKAITVSNTGRYPDSATLFLVHDSQRTNVSENLESLVEILEICRYVEPDVEERLSAQERNCLPLQLARDLIGQ